MTEYVRLAPPESLYGEKHILHSELGMLNIIKRIRSYNKFRQEELVLRLAVKKKVDEIRECFELLDKLLPHDKLAGLKKEQKAKEDIAGGKAEISLEQELEMIRRRLENLREN